MSLVTWIAVGLWVYERRSMIYSQNDLNRYASVLHWYKSLPARNALKSDPSHFVSICREHIRSCYWYCTTLAMWWYELLYPSINQLQKFKFTSVEFGCTNNLNWKWWRYNSTVVMQIVQEIHKKAGIIMLKLNNRHLQLGFQKWTSMQKPIGQRQQSPQQQIINACSVRDHC